MASEFAVDLAEKVLMEDHAETIRRVDNSLQEVREVVKLAAHPKFDAGGDGVHYYLTKADIERARALLSKLEVRP
jgi:hypothetical protein